MEGFPSRASEGAEPPIPAQRLGIDVSARYQDIRRITIAHFGRAGIEIEDLVQEVMLAILRRNEMPRSAYDPSKSGLSHYVYLIAHNVACNALEARRRHDRLALVPEPPEELADAHDPLAAYEHVRDSMRVSRTRPLNRDEVRGGRAILN